MPFCGLKYYTLERIKYMSNCTGERWIVKSDAMCFSIKKETETTRDTRNIISCGNSKEMNQLLNSLYSPLVISLAPQVAWMHPLTDVSLTSVSFLLLLWVALTKKKKMR